MPLSHRSKKYLSFAFSLTDNDRSHPEIQLLNNECHLVEMEHQTVQLGKQIDIHKKFKATRKFSTRPVFGAAHCSQH